MIHHVEIDGELSLPELQDQLNEHEGALGVLIALGYKIALGHKNAYTIADYDDEGAGGGPIVLRPGPSVPRRNEEMICSGKVLVLGQEQTVTAYRRTG